MMMISFAAAIEVRIEASGQVHVGADADASLDASIWPITAIKSGMAARRERREAKERAREAKERAEAQAYQEHLDYTAMYALADEMVDSDGEGMELNTRRHRISDRVGTRIRLNTRGTTGVAYNGETATIMDPTKLEGPNFKAWQQAQRENRGIYALVLVQLERETGEKFTINPEHIVDPSLLSFQSGARVRIEGTSRENINHRTGVVVSGEQTFQPNEKRNTMRKGYTVQLDSVEGKQNGQAVVKAKNLVPIS